MNQTRVFISFDLEHDGELYAQLLAQSRSSTSSFSVLGSSEPSTATEVSSEKVREGIRDADQVIVICGEHTHESIPMRAELKFTQQEDKPYFLLWGRREIMCTKPVGAKPNDAMYSWTRMILQDRISNTLRKSQPDPTAVALRHATRKA